MSNGERLTAKRYDGKGYYMNCSACCDIRCDECPTLDEIINRLGELEYKQELLDALVRCKDCDHCAINHGIYFCVNPKGIKGIVRPEQYCSEAERRPQDAS